MTKSPIRADVGCATIFKREIIELIAELKMVPGMEAQVKVLEKWLK